MDAFRPIEEEVAPEVSIEEEEEEPVEEEKGYKRPIRCPSCKEIFITKDPGERPWMLFCTQCGAKGLIKDERRLELPPGKDEKKEKEKPAGRRREKVKCPECSEIFGTWSDEKEIECPNCGTTGER
jgi:DNA-directed RNA polymerase subunit RPC12/RpoP